MKREQYYKKSEISDGLFTTVCVLYTSVPRTLSSLVFLSPGAYDEPFSRFGLGVLHFTLLFFVLVGRFPPEEVAQERG